MAEADDEAIDAYNDGYTHEALRTTSVLMDTLTNFFMESRTAREFPEVAAAADRAHQALFDLYHAIGQRLAMITPVTCLDGQVQAATAPPPVAQEE